jgi:hypothetical protein
MDRHNHQTAILLLRPQGMEFEQQGPQLLPRGLKGNEWMEEQGKFNIAIAYINSRISHFHGRFWCGFNKFLINQIWNPYSIDEHAFAAWRLLLKNKKFIYLFLFFTHIKVIVLISFITGNKGAYKFGEYWIYLPYCAIFFWNYFAFLGLVKGIRTSSLYNWRVSICNLNLVCMKNKIW